MLTLEGMIASYDGRIVLRRSANGSDPQELGRRVASDLLNVAGGSAIDEWSEPGVEQ